MNKKKIILIITIAVASACILAAAVGVIAHFCGDTIMSFFTSDNQSDISDVIDTKYVYEPQEHGEGNLSPSTPSDKAPSQNQINSEGDKSNDNPNNKDNKGDNKNNPPKDDVSKNETPTSNPDTSSSEDTPPEVSEESREPNVTITAQVSNDICVVGGTCSSDTQYITVTGGVDTVTIFPFAGERQNYFLGQVKINSSTSLNITATEKNKNPSDIVNAYVSRKNMTNQLTAGEYRPFFGKNSRTHFYSSLLAYSLSGDKITDSIKSQASSNISEIVNTASSVGAETIFFIIPSSAEIYPETVPEGFAKPNGRTVYDEFKDIATSCGATVIYPFDSMNAHKNDGKGMQIYQHTDSHWSAYGSYWGTYDLFNYISSKFPAAKPRTLEEMDFYTAELAAGDSMFSFPANIGFENPNSSSRQTTLTWIKELTNLYRLPMPTDTLSQAYYQNSALCLNNANAAAQTFTNSRGDGLPTAVIMRDSFSKVSFDMINDRFKKIYWGEFNNYSIPYNNIYSGNPDYVIYFYSERNLLKIMLNDSNAKITTLVK